MSNVAQSHPSPHRARAGLSAQLFGAATAPLFWIGQLVLSSTLTNMVCRAGSSGPHGALHASLLCFDALAIAAAIAGGLVAHRCWNATHHEASGGSTRALEAGEGRSRFLALWGLLASLWFLFAIVFNTIASLMVPPCIN